MGGLTTLGTQLANAARNALAQDQGEHGDALRKIEERFPDDFEIRALQFEERVRAHEQRVNAAITAFEKAWADKASREDDTPDTIRSIASGWDPLIGTLAGVQASLSSMSNAAGWTGEAGTSYFDKFPAQRQAAEELHAAVNAQKSQVEKAALLHEGVNVQLHTVGSEVLSTITSTPGPLDSVYYVRSAQARVSLTSLLGWVNYFTSDAADWQSSVAAIDSALHQVSSSTLPGGFQSVAGGGAVAVPTRGNGGDTSGPIGGGQYDYEEGEGYGVRI